MREAVPAQPPRPSQLHLQVGGDSRGAPGQGLGGGGPGWSGLGAGMAQPEPGLWSLTPPRAPMWHWREAQSPTLLTRVGVGAAGASPPPHPPAAGAGRAGLPGRAGTSITHHSSGAGEAHRPLPPMHRKGGRGVWRPQPGVSSPAACGPVQRGRAGSIHRRSSVLPPGGSHHLGPILTGTPGALILPHLAPRGYLALQTPSLSLRKEASRWTGVH